MDNKSLKNAKPISDYEFLSRAMHSAQDSSDYIGLVSAIVDPQLELIGYSLDRSRMSLAFADNSNQSFINYDIVPEEGVILTSEIDTRNMVFPGETPKNVPYGDPKLEALLETLGAFITRVDIDETSKLNSYKLN